MSSEYGAGNTTPGCKHTKGGVIPEDWLEYTVGELIDFEGGSQPNKRVFSFTSRPGYVRLIQIRDYKTDKYETYVPITLARRFCTESDIMIGRYGPPIFQILRGLSGAYNVALIKAKPQPQINRTYAYYFLKQDKLFEFIDKLSQRSSGQTGVDLKELRGYPLPLPPTKGEQKAIAEALSDADTLIESLDQLIVKKRQIKQGAMQELLTGKRKLPGFSGEWEERRLGDECELITKGTTPTSIGKNFTDDGIKFIKVESLDSNGRIIYDKVAFIDEETNKLLNRSQLKENDLLISIAGALGRTGVVEKEVLPANTNQALAIARIKPNSHLNLLYVFHFFRLEKMKKHIEGISVQGAQANLSLQNIADLPIYAPDFEEQTAIATILSDMDAEITALEEKLAKTRQLKQGMMQELLTGRIRLI